ncbi:hypothetical protein [Methylomagnum ishizawai]|uniref:hypothetical protein n=1 Tax=Methylomagnum ishizawai TaxID=1760988 RepID=UPI001C33E945|nr:hypothetical protein [Methylomagnum ishizawai]BBL74932.1 hypothetical protein MishRS11D_20300 [Methylomagnum ishizawai]
MKTSILALLLGGFALPALADMAVIAHPGNGLAALSEREARDIFLGRTRLFPNQRFALPLDQASPLRAEFYQRLTGRPIEQIDAYWARLLFTGQSSPPPQLPDDAAVLRTVRENQDALGYIDAAHVDATVRVLLMLR